MREDEIKYVIWILIGLVVMAITFYVFGAELPVYLLFALSGLFLYMYSENPSLKFIGGFSGRLFATLFMISLIYYFGTRTFFPSNPFNFIFLKVGLQLTIETFNWMSDFIGKLVLRLIDIIIP